MLDRYDQDLLLDYLEGELDADRRAQLDALLAEDPQLAALLEALSADRAALRALPREQAPADLAHDVTQSLERRMLLDDAAVDTGPMPIARGRDLPGEPTGGLRWGRIAGLSALAASVALAAGIVVITLGPDPLTRTAQSLADEEAETESADATTGEATGATDALASTGPSERKPGADAARTPERLASDAAADRARRAPGGDAAAAARAANEPDRVEAPAGRAAAPALATRPDTPQPAAALAVADLRQQLVLFTEEPELTREQLVAYCVTNGIPIVQTNLPTNADDAETNNGKQDVHAAQAPLIDANYALLVDEPTLNKLLLTMNDNAPDDAVAVKRNRLSNQAAVLTDIAPGQFDQAAALTAPPADTTDDRPTTDAPESQPDTPANPIELRLPGDLGSSYANSLNKYNFDAEQQRNTGNYQADQAVAEGTRADSPLQREALDQAPPAAQQKAAFDKHEAQPDATEQAEHAVRPQDATSNQPADALEEAADDAQPEEGAIAEVDRILAPQPEPTLDPTRGNWLAPHLPLANTTPILNWRHDQEQRKAQLVPILIQRAPTDQVNSVRLKQQAQYGRPAEQAPAENNAVDAESNRDAEEPIENTAEDAPPTEE
jgi:hypothetical protein